MPKSGKYRENNEDRNCSYCLEKRGSGVGSVKQGRRYKVQCPPTSHAAQHYSIHSSSHFQANRFLRRPEQPNHKKCRLVGTVNLLAIECSSATLKYRVWRDCRFFNVLRINDTYAYHATSQCVATVHTSALSQTILVNMPFFLQQIGNGRD